MKVTLALDKKTILIAAGFSAAQASAVQGNAVIFYGHEDVVLSGRTRRVGPVAQNITEISGPMNQMIHLLTKISKVHNLNDIEVL